MNYLKIVKKNFLIFVLFFIFFLFYDNLVFTIPFLLKDNNISLRYFGYILAGGTILRSILGGYLSNKGDNLKIKFYLYSIGIITAFLAFFFENIIFLTIFFILVISVATTFNITLNPIISRINKNDNLGIVFGVRDVFLYMGSGLGLAAAGYLLKNGFDSIIKFNLIMGIILLLFSIYFFVTISKNNKIVLKETIQYKYKDVIKDKDITQYLFLTIVFTLAGGAISFLPLFGEEIEINKRLIYYIFSGSIFISAFFSLVGGYLIDKFNRKGMYLLYILAYIIIYISLLFNNKILFYIAVFFYTFNMIIANVLPSYFFENYNDNYWGLVSTVSLISGSFIDIFIGYFWSDRKEFIIYFMLTLSILSFLLAIKILKNKNDSIVETL